VTPASVLITGAGGQLGRQLVMAFDRAGWAVTGLRRADLDIADSEAVRRLADAGAAVFINAAAWTDVDGCARDPRRALRINGEAAGYVAEAAAACGALAVQVSTNEVFDGSQESPYAEDDAVNPINPYGESKLAGERAVAAATGRHLIVRTAWLFGPGGTNFPGKIIAAALRQRAAGELLRVVADEIGNPTWTPDLAEGMRAAVTAVVDGRLAPGTLHLCGQPPISRYGWAEQILRPMSDAVLVPIQAAEFTRASRSPRRAVLSTARAELIGVGPFDWRGPSERYAADIMEASGDAA